MKKKLRKYIFYLFKKKRFAPGEARTLNLRISLPLVSGEGTVYKYGALTDCATGAPVK